MTADEDVPEPTIPSVMVLMSSGAAMRQLLLSTPAAGVRALLKPERVYVSGALPKVGR